MRKFTPPNGLVALGSLLLFAACGGSTSNNPSAGGGTGGASAGGTTSAGGAGGSGATPTTGGAGGGSGSGTGGAAGGTGGAAAGTGGGAPTGGSATSGGAGGALGGSSGVATGGASGTGSGAGGSAVSGGLTLTIEPNPNSTLSCFVSWKTDQPASSTVQFGETTYDWEISDAAMVTDHKVLVIGMHAAKPYKIKAISGSASGEGMFTTGALPDAIPVGKVMINDTAKSQAGWTLMNVQKGQTGADATRARSDYPPMAVMYDAGGEPVWYVIDGTTMTPDIGGAVSTQLTDKGVLVGPTWNTSLTNGIPPREFDFAGNVIWECKHAACLPGKNVTHHASKLPNGHYVIIEYVNGSGGAQNPVYREVDADNKEVWSLDWASVLPAPSGSTGDWCHANAITVDIDKNSVWANCRWMGVLKTTYTNPTKQWLLPAKYGSKGQGDFTYSPTTSQYSDAHDPEIHEDDDTILFFDNGGYGSGAVGGVTTQFHSRAVEYKLDETAKTATMTWEFPGSFAVPDAWYTSNWYTPFWGDADRLPNGNVLITGGIRSETVESRVFEVTKADGKVVWEFRFPPTYGVYRSDRIVPPLVHPVAK